MSKVIDVDFNKKKKDDEFKCSLCGISHEKNDGIPMVGSVDIRICGNCISDCYELICESDDSKKISATIIKQEKTPSKIVEFVNQYVIGQDSAKRTLALAIYNHYKRVNNRVVDDVELQKSNILMIGPTGTGKTHLAQSIARFLDIPFAIADATTLSATGYIGEDASSVLQRLISSADGDVTKAERGIVFIDEICKLAKKTVGASNNKDPSGEGVQQELLKMIEGSVCKVPVEGARKVSSEKMQSIDTTHILFICAGAFVHLDDIIRKNHIKTNVSMGFTATVKNDEKVVLPTPEPDDLYEFGMIPELVGRLPIITTLSELSVDALFSIIKEPKNSVLKQFQAMIKMDDAELVMEDSAITKIAEMAYERKTGARGLRSIMENVLNPVMFELPDTPEVKKIVVSVKDDEFVIEKVTEQKITASI